MSQKTSWLKDHLAEIVLITLLLAVVIFAGVMMRAREIASQGNWTTPVNPNVTARGTVVEVKLNYKSYGLGGYHVFPALIIFNVTETVWMSDEVQTLINHDINNTFYSQFWKAGNLRSVGYDNKDVPSLTEGSLIEASGYWLYTTDSPYSMKLVVAPNVIGSYVKSLP